MVQLLDNAYFRAGSLRYAKNNNTYGLTTLRSKHISINNNTAEFDYVGKSGKKQHKEVSDSTLSRTLNDLEDIPGYELFKFRDKDNKTHKIDRNMLNQYIKEVMGESFTAKDFRTWAGTYLAATLLDELGIAKSQKIAKSNISQAIDKVASILGNTPNITKSSYIDPKVITSYSEGITLSQYIQEVQREIESEDLFNKNERAVFSLLSDID